MKQNIENIQETIDLIKECKRVYMPIFQRCKKGIATTLEDFHTCGNTACIEGYMALTESFSEAGGKVSPLGDAHILVDECVCGNPTAYHFAIPKICANLLVTGEYGDYFVTGWRLWGWKEAVKALEVTRDFDFTTEECEEDYFDALCSIVE